jgi:hypothetical protein
MILPLSSILEIRPVVGKYTTFSMKTPQRLVDIESWSHIHESLATSSEQTVM